MIEVVSNNEKSVECEKSVKEYYLLITVLSLCFLQVNCIRLNKVMFAFVNTLWSVATTAPICHCNVNISG